MKGSLALNDGDTSYVLSVAHISFVKITPNGDYRSVEFHIDGEPPITMDKVAPSDVEKIIELLSN